MELVLFDFVLDVQPAQDVYGKRKDVPRTLSKYIGGCPNIPASWEIIPHGTTPRSHLQFFNMCNAKVI